ncbi:MAG: CDP-alcohol phosphatidyltransferase family protein [Arenicella sp.]
MIYIPNLLTLLRIGLVPIIVILIDNHQYGFSLLVFAIAGISDGLDGYIAKHYDCETKLGAILDPLADKCLLVSAFITLAVMEHLPFWLVVIVVFRDIIIVGGCIILSVMYERIDMKPLLVSKLNTLLQILLVIMILLQLSELFGGIELSLQGVIEIGGVLVGITSIVSGLIYVCKWSMFAMRGES